MLPQLLTVQEVAAALKVQLRVVYAACSRNKPTQARLKSTRVGHGLRFKPEWVNEYLEARTK